MSFIFTFQGVSLVPLTTSYYVWILRYRAWVLLRECSTKLPLNYAEKQVARELKAWLKHSRQTEMVPIEFEREMIFFHRLLKYTLLNIYVMKSLLKNLVLSRQVSQISLGMRLDFLKIYSLVNGKTCNLWWGDLSKNAFSY